MSELLNPSVFEKNKIHFSEVIAILFLTLISILSINQYQYGTYDHAISVPFLKSVVDHSIYPGDYLLAEKTYFYTYFWNFLGMVIRYFNLDIPTIFFIGHLISIFATFILDYMLALLLFKKREVAILSLIFLIFSINTIGGTATIDSLFLTRTAVLPILLLSIYLFLKQRFILSYLFQGIGFLFHPLTAVYVCGILFIASLFVMDRIGLKRFMLCMGVLVVCALPLLVWKIMYPAPTLKLFHADPNWIELLRLRSSHHLFPFSWLLRNFIISCMFVVGFIISWKHKPEDYFHRVVKGCTLAVIAFCLIGTIFTEVYPVSIIIQFQLFRSFPFLVYLALLYYANYFLMEENNFMKVITAILFLSLYYISFLKLASLTFIVTLVILLSAYFTRKEKAPVYKFYLLSASGIILLLGMAGLYLRGSFKVENSQEKSWLDVQYWAKNNTGTTDAFIVPPSLIGFRVESERSIYGDWKDGTQMFFNPQFGYEWIRRMKMLGYTPNTSLKKSYSNLPKEKFEKIAHEMEGYRKVYVVMYKDKKLNYPAVYENDEFAIYVVKNSKDKTYLTHD